MKKLTDAERLEIVKRLAVMDRQMLVGVREVAVLLNTSVASIQQACSKMRIARGDVALKLPQRVGGLGRRVAWLYGDVRDFLAQAQPTGNTDAPVGAEPAHVTRAVLKQPRRAAPSTGATTGSVRMGRKRQA
jgi:hypothetical protein